MSRHFEHQSCPRGGFWRGCDIDDDSVLQAACAAVAEVCGLLDNSEVNPNTYLAEHLGLDWVDMPIVLSRLLNHLSIPGDMETCGRFIRRARNASTGSEPLHGIMVRDVAPWTLWMADTSTS
jgi:hypothetical protein